MLEVDNLQAGYGGAQVLHGVCLRSQPGELTCLLGRNGAGKTTTLKCLMGLLAPKGGSVMLGGAAIGGLPAHEVARRGVGYVPEERLIFPTLTVWENLAMGLRRGNRRQAAEDVLELFPRLRDKLQARGGTLSGGEQQMLAIGRALISKPRLLLVDDPTEGLAPVIVQALERALRQLVQAGAAVLVVESKLAVASRIADRIYVLAKGKTMFAGTPQDLQDNQEVRREYLEV